MLQEPKRLMHVIDSLGLGGAERVVTTLASAQARVGKVQVVSLFPPGDLAGELRAAGVGVVEVGLGRGKSFASSVLHLDQAARHFKPDVIHAHLTLSILATGLIRARGARKVGTFHNLGIAGGRTGSYRVRAFRAIVGLVARRRFTSFTAVTSKAAQAYEREFRLASSPLVIPNPVDVDAIRRAVPETRVEVRQRLGVPRGRRLLVFVGKFSWAKAVDVLLEALALMPTSGRPQVALVGDGPLRADLERRAKALGLERDVVWRGTLPHGLVLEWLRASDAMVLPSRSEGQPVSILEAMAVGTPVIATSVGGIPNLLDRGRGIVVPAEDPRALASALEAGCADEKMLQDCAELASGYVEREFGLAHVLSQWEALFGSL